MEMLTSPSPATCQNCVERKSTYDYMLTATMLGRSAHAIHAQASLFL